MGTQHGIQTADATSSALDGQVEEREAEWEAWRAWWAQRAGEGKAEEAWVDEGGTEDAWEEAEGERCAPRVNASPGIKFHVWEFVFQSILENRI